VVQLRSVPMPTQYGGTKPRPHFHLAGWKTTDGAVEQAQIAGPTADIDEPSLSEKMGGDEVPDFNDPLDGSILDTPKTSAPPKRAKRA
jgi:hypothetical protein